MDNPLPHDRHDRLSDNELLSLAALCHDASPGPWKAERFDVVRARAHRSGVVPSSAVARCGNRADAVFVAAASPTAMRRLIDEIMALRATLAEIAGSTESPMRSISLPRLARAALGDDSDAE